MLRMMIFLAAMALTNIVPAQTVLTGTTPSGAYYRIAVPSNWKNG